ncbi:MAG: FliG C-terminal domain-containing protein [Alphaproteobacteria bacterium]
MKISARKVAPDVYAITFDDTEVVLEGGDIKTLLMEVMKIMAPGGSTRKSAEKNKEFLRHIKNANDVGIQKLLLVADHDDLLVLLKKAEDDQLLQDKFYNNMSDTNRKMFVEDLNYQFQGEVPLARERDAFKRLMVTASELESDGSLVYENVKSR